MVIFRHFKNLMALCLCLCGFYIACQKWESLLVTKEDRLRARETVHNERQTNEATSRWMSNGDYGERRRVTVRFSVQNYTVIRETSTSVKCNELWKISDRDSEWFKKNFDPSVKPIWAKENIDLKPAVFDWWINLRTNNQSYESVISLATQLAVTSDPFHGNQPRDCITCAVVGNSGNLRNSGYGKRIDNHEVIIRMNESPVAGYEKDVGSNTTHYIAYPESFKTSSLRNASFVLAPFCYKDMEWLHGQLKQSSGSKSVLNKNKVFVMNPELMWHIKHIWGLGKGRWASTGVLGVFFALQMCDEVDVFGFGANAKGNWDHYFSKDDGEKNSQFKQTLVHDDEAERLLLKNLVEEKKITLYTGSR